MMMRIIRLRSWKIMNSFTMWKMMMMKLIMSIQALEMTICMNAAIASMRPEKLQFRRMLRIKMKTRRWKMTVIQTKLKTKPAIQLEGIEIKFRTEETQEDFINTDYGSKFITLLSQLYCYLIIFL